MAMLAATQVSGSAERFRARGPESSAGGARAGSHSYSSRLSLPGLPERSPGRGPRGFTSARRSFLKTP